MKFYIETFGCKVNAYESNYINKIMIDNGFIQVNNEIDADIVIVNTCAVTNTASSKCKKYLRRVRRENKECILVCMGCASQKDKEVFKNMDIDIILGNYSKSKVVEYINEYIKTKERFIYITDNRNLPFEDMDIDNFNHVRAFIKIQDGCDNFCSYCIIPYLRGKCRSRDFLNILREAKSLAKNGHKEIVLTGIHTGSYNFNGLDLVDLIEALSEIDEIERIRLSSVEVTELNAKFMNMLKTNTKFCNHLHIPIQSGSNKVLKDMGRKYDVNYFKKKIAEIRNIREDISITTDLIVGYPTETEENFLETLDNLKKIKFSKIHVFPFSKRDGTKASNLKELNDAIKTERVHKVLELSKELELDYESKFKGRAVDVLIEEVKNGKSIGHTTNYLKVEVDKELERNKIYKIVY